MKMSMIFTGGPMIFSGIFACIFMTNADQKKADQASKCLLYATSYFKQKIIHVVDSFRTNKHLKKIMGQW